MVTIVHVPTINDTLSDFNKLFAMWAQVKDGGLNVRFDFSHCGFLRQNAVVFLGGLARLIEYRAGTAEFNWSSMRDSIRMNLAQNGFLASFGGSGGPWTGNSIPYREDRSQDSTGLMDYLKAKWLGRGWVYVSSRLRDEIMGRVWEIYANAFEHGQSEIGIFSCGQHYPHKHELALTVLDFGVGIPSNVRIFAGNSNIHASKTLEWAFKRGTTTKPNGTSRGLGLDLLKEFVRLNNGKIELFSHEGHAIISQNDESYEDRAVFFEGTLVNITLRCDESYYRFADETPSGPLF